jgi:DNA-directed RNA polymerase specialized sigma24 family protein
MKQRLFDALAQLRWAKNHTPGEPHEREEKAFVQVIRPVVRRFLQAKWQGRPHQILEELQQDIVLAAVRGAGRCQATHAKAAQGWLYGIARRKLADALKDEVYERPEPLAARPPHPEREAAQRDVCQRLTRRTDDLADAASVGAASVARHGTPADLCRGHRSALGRDPAVLRQRLEVMLTFYLGETSRTDLAARYGVKPALISTWLTRGRTIASVGLQARHRGHPPLEDPELIELVGFLIHASILEEGCP